MVIKKINDVIFMINILFIAAFIAVIFGVFLFKMNYSVKADGIVEPQNQTLVKAPISGLVEEIYAEEGKTIEKDSPMFLITGAEVETDNKIIMEDFKLKEYIHSNIKKLYEEGIVSKREFLEVERDYVTAKLRKEQISKTIVKAPSGGFVITNSELSLKKGDYVNKGDLLAKISNLERYTVKLNVQEKDIYKVKIGQKVVVQIKGFSSYRYIHKGEVIKILPEGKIDAENHRFVFEVIALITNVLDSKEEIHHINIYPMMGVKTKIVYRRMTFFEYLKREIVGNESN